MKLFDYIATPFGKGDDNEMVLLEINDIQWGIVFILMIILLFIIGILLLALSNMHFEKSAKIEYKIDKAEVVDKKMYVSISETEKDLPKDDSKYIYYVYINYENEEYCIEDEKLYKQVRIGDRIEVNVKKISGENKRNITSITLKN